MREMSNCFRYGYDGRVVGDDSPVCISPVYWEEGRGSGSTHSGIPYLFKRRERESGGVEGVI